MFYNKRRRRKLIDIQVDEVSLVDDPANRKSFYFFKGKVLGMNKKLEKALGILELYKDEMPDDLTEAVGHITDLLPGSSEESMKDIKGADEDMQKARMTKEQIEELRETSATFNTAYRNVRKVIQSLLPKEVKKEDADADFQKEVLDGIIGIRGEIKDLNIRVDGVDGKSAKDEKKSEDDDEDEDEDDDGKEISVEKTLQLLLTKMTKIEKTARPKQSNDDDDDDDDGKTKEELKKALDEKFPLAFESVQKLGRSA